MTEFEKNQQVADEIGRTRTWKARHFAEGDCVLLIDGAVHAVGKSLHVVLREFELTGGDPSHAMAFEVRDPVVDVIR